MTTILDQQLPAFQWPLDNNRFTVRSTKSSNGELTMRQFELLDGPGPAVLTSKVFQSANPGRCVQEWNRKDAACNLNVKMFASDLHNIYYVVTDIVHRELGIYTDRLTEGKYLTRIYEEEPGLDKSWLGRICGCGYLPSSIDWRKIAANAGETWSRKNHECEVGLTITENIPGSGRREDLILHSLYAQNTNSLWSMMNVIQRKTATFQGLVGELHDSNLPQRETVTLASTISATCLPQYGVYAAIDGSVSMRAGPLRMAPYNQFLTEHLSLSLVSIDTIRQYFLNTCCKVDDHTTEYVRASIQVTKKTYQFEAGLYLNAVHIHLEKTMIRRAVNAVWAWMPALSQESRQREDELYSQEINEKMIEAAVLDPTDSAGNRRRGLDEMDKAFERTAALDLCVSVDKCFGAVIADQRLPRGYTFRQGVRSLVVRSGIVAVNPKVIV